MQSLKFCATVLLGLSALAFCGCDSRPKRAVISGQVLVDGEPLTQGVVQFVPDGTRPSTGKINEDGSFTMTCYGEGDGAILGTHKVAIMGMEILSPSKIKWHAPKKYANTRTSGLTITVDGARDDVVFDLTWDGGKPFVEVSGSSSEKMGDDV